MVNNDAFTDSYCANLINWPITNETLANYRLFDQNAKDLYTQLYWKWDKYGGQSSDPTNDCLGIARTIFCAYSFRYCNKGVDEIAVCDFLCILW